MADASVLSNADINLVLSSAKSSFDPFHVGLSSDTELEDLRYAYMAVEDLRFSFRAESTLPPVDSAKILQAAANLTIRISNLILDDRFRSTAERSHFEILLPDVRSTNFSLAPALRSKTLNVFTALDILSDSIRTIIDAPGFAQSRPKITNAQAVSALLEIVPVNQALGPAQFRVDSEGIIRLVEQGSKEFSKDTPSINEARTELISSNCDRRIVENVENLQSRISLKKDIIRLGLINLHCESMCVNCRDELPSSIYSMIEAHVLGVHMYVSQFPEWRRFSDQATSSRIIEEHKTAMSKSLRSILHDLSEKPAIAEPEVPRTLAAIRALLDDPKGASKRSLFAAWRTLENFFQSVFKFGIDFLRKTANLTSDALSKMVSKGIAASVLAAAVGGAILIAPLANALESTGWIQKAAQIVKQQMEIP
jgi:hypothetical protein